MNPILGIFFHAVGGLAAGSFYIPYKKVRNWSWEVYWITGGFFSWILAPLVVSIITVPDLPGLFATIPLHDLAWPYIFGVLWGIGGLTFGLTMRYLGLSLGMAMALGLTAAFGTIIPPVYRDEFGTLISNLSGWITLSGVLVCLAGIAVTGKAGMIKDKELSEEKKQATIKEFNMKKGIWVAFFAGVMSACFAFGISAGKPIAEHAVKLGTPDLFKNSPVFIVILAGGFTTNFLWCLILCLKNNSLKDFVKTINTPRLANYFFSALAGITWYLQFMFYGMGTTKLGKYDFASWSIHMAFIIVFSNMWGLIFREWKGSNRRTILLVLLGLSILILSVIIIGIGNYIQKYDFLLNLCL